MNISTLHPYQRALPYQGVSVQAGLRTKPGGAAAHEEADGTVGANDESRVEQIDQANSSTTRRQQQNPAKAVAMDKLVYPTLFMEKMTVEPRSMPGPQILSALIEQMSGADLKPVTARRVDIAI